MLLQGHYLKHIVAESLDPRKHVAAEFVESGDLLLLGAHAYVAFVDQGMGALARPAVLPLIRFGIPDLGGENLRLRILHHPRHVCRKSLAATSRPFDPEFVELAVMQEHRRQPQLPVSGTDRAEGIAFRAFPVVGLTYKKNPRGVRRPFADDPGVALPVKRIVDVVVHGGGQGSVPRKFLSVGEDTLVSRVDSPPERFEPGVGHIDFLSHKLSVLVLSVLRYSRQRPISSSERRIYLSMSSSAVDGSSTFSAMSSSSSRAFE